MLIYLDACAIIEAREKLTDAGQSLSNIMIEAFERRVALRTCELSLLEVLVYPITGLRSPNVEVRNDSKELHDWYVRNLVPNGRFIDTISISTQVLASAATLRSQTPSLKAPDAIHLAAAQISRCSHFITGDDRLMKSIARHRAQDPLFKIETVELDCFKLDALAEAIVR
jgi:predicted nucleic acid-binding protein